MFKVGDICKLKVKHDYDLYRFIRIDGNRAYLQDRLGFTEFGINKDVVLHATPEEIAAGHRIENDMGDDSHIENHISKNCKVIENE